MINKITKAVLPVAGRGTRVMPLTLHQPKAMIGIVDKPMVHYLIDEVVAAGIRNIILVIAPGQSIFKNYLNFIQQDKEWKKIGVRFDIAIQKQPKGNGDALLPAEKFIKKGESFLTAFADDIIPFQESPIKNLIATHLKFGSPILTLEKIPKKLISQYGIIKPGKKIGNLYEIKDIVEKPDTDKAPSNLGVTGRYVLPYSIFESIRTTARQIKNKKEIYLTDAFKTHLKKGGQLHAWLFNGIKFDAGSKLGLLKAQAYFGIHHKELKKEFRKYLRKITN